MYLRILAPRPKVVNMKHITAEQRYLIDGYLFIGLKQSEIAVLIEKSKSTISRELKKRSQQDGSYKASVAQLHYLRQRRKCGKTPLLEQPAIKEFVENQIQNDKSPEQIAGIMKTKKMSIQLSHETIYKHIWKDKSNGGKLHSHLRNRGRRYRKRGDAYKCRSRIAGRVGIEQRPAIVAEKQRIGDIEVDLIVGKNHKQAVLTAVDRKSGIGWLRKLTAKHSNAVEKAMVELLLPLKGQIYTITSDNGSEFANHKSIARQLQVDYYFARPYHSWERGCNENYNRLVRQYIPKGTDFRTITEEQVLEIEKKLNSRERKRLGFISPYEYFAQNLPKVAFGP